MELTVVSGLSLWWDAELDKFNIASTASSEVSSVTLCQNLQRNKVEKEKLQHSVSWLAFLC